MTSGRKLERGKGLAHPLRNNPGERGPRFKADATLAAVSLRPVRPKMRIVRGMGTPFVNNPAKLGKAPGLCWSLVLLPQRLRMGMQ